MASYLKTCRYCDSLIDPDAHICPSCGRKLNRGPEKFCGSCGAPRGQDVKFYLPEDARIVTEQEELKILGEILEAYIDTPIEKDAFLISDLGLDSFLIVYFISEVDDRFGVTIEMPEHVEYMTVQDVLDQLNQKN